MSETYDLQRLYAEKAGEAFTFRWADREWTLPSVYMLDIEVQHRVENVDSNAGMDALNSLFDDLLGAEQGARWREVTRPLPMIFDLFQAWMDHSKGALGESAASTGSSKSTGRPSKRTSKPSTASDSRKPSSRRSRTTGTAPVNS